MLSRRRGKKYKLIRKLLFCKKKDICALTNEHHALFTNIRCTVDPWNCIISVRESAVITQNQLEACRKIVARRLRRIKPKGSASYYSPLRFTLPITVKSKNSRMGKGKGKFDSFIARVKAFEPIFVLRNVPRNCGIGLANKMRYKLPAPLSVSRYKYSVAGERSHHTVNSRIKVSCVTQVRGYSAVTMLLPAMGDSVSSITGILNDYATVLGSQAFLVNCILLTFVLAYIYVRIIRMNSTNGSGSSTNGSSSENTNNGDGSGDGADPDKDKKTGWRWWCCPESSGVTLLGYKLTWTQAILGSVVLGASAYSLYKSGVFTDLYEWWTKPDNKFELKQDVKNINSNSNGDAAFNFTLEKCKTKLQVIDFFLTKNPNNDQLLAQESKLRNIDNMLSDLSPANGEQVDKIDRLRQYIVKLREKIANMAEANNNK